MDNNAAQEFRRLIDGLFTVDDITISAESDQSIFISLIHNDIEFTFRVVEARYTD